VKIKSLKEEEIKQLKTDLDLMHIGERITMIEMREILRKFEATYLESEICKDGCASDFCFELSGPK